MYSGSKMTPHIDGTAVRLDRAWKLATAIDNQLASKKRACPQLGATGG